jgi:hypothetical protein
MFYFVRISEYVESWVSYIITYIYETFCKLKTFIVISRFGITNKLTPWPLVRKRTIPTERPPLVGEI